MSSKKAEAMKKKYLDLVGPTIQAIPHLTYDQPRGKSGVSENLDWKGERIFTASSPARCHCVGAVGELLLRLMRGIGLEKVITADELKRFRAHLFIYESKVFRRPDGTQSTYFGGGAGGLAALGWGHLVPVAQARKGDVAQIWHVHPKTGEAIRGHAVFVLGQETRSGKPALRDWSASPTRPSGHKRDWHWHSKTITRKGQEYHRVIVVGRFDFEALSKRQPLGQ